MQIIQSIQNRIFTFRGMRVMLDYDLADLYDVGTKVLNQAVKRNADRFPDDFMFRLTSTEWDNMRSQFVTAPGLQRINTLQSRRNIEVTPYAFTEQGVAMLSSVLHSEKAVQMNIAIMRAFVEMRKLSLQPFDLTMHLQQLANKLSEHDVQLNQIYEALENLLDDKAAKRKWDQRERIGFK